VIDLVNSTNASWVYTNFAPGTGRSGWGNLGQTLYGGIYTGVHGTYDAAYPVIGLFLRSVLVGNIINQDTTTDLYWKIYHPGQINEFSATGAIFRSGTTFGQYTIEAQNADLTYWTAPVPTLVNTWEDFTLSNISTAMGAPSSLIFRFHGALGTSSPAPTAYAELSTLTISVLYPLQVVALGVEQANYLLSGSLLNNTTGHSIIFNNIVAKLNETITIDCATQEVYGADGKRIRSMIQFGGAKRDEWMTLVSGANSIIFTDTGTQEVQIITTWYSKGTI
jgi:hypothetical protein